MSAAAGTHLVIERHGQLWAVPGAAVERLARFDGRVTVRLRTAGDGGEGSGGGPGGELAADRLLAVAGHLVVVPAPAALGRFWSEPVVGLALFAGRPAVVIDPARPPRALAAASEGGHDGGDGPETAATEGGRDGGERRGAAAAVRAGVAAGRDPVSAQGDGGHDFGGSR